MRGDPRFQACIMGHQDCDKDHQSTYAQAMRAMDLMDAVACGPEDDSCDLGHRCAQHTAVMEGL